MILNILNGTLLDTASFELVGERHLTIEDGRIIGVGADQRGDTQEQLDGVLLPGAIDLQVNGAGGRSAEEATAEALEQIAQTVRSGGATAFLPTLITAPFDALLDQVRAVASWCNSYDGPGARPLGLHGASQPFDIGLELDQRRQVPATATGVEFGDDVDTEARRAAEQAGAGGLDHFEGDVDAVGGFGIETEMLGPDSP